jgi:predicted acetyltransferase
VERLHARTPDTLRTLWSVIASNCSVVGEVSGWIAPNDPSWWLTKERDATITRRRMWMLRVVDAAAAVAGRGFPPGLTVGASLEIRDENRPANTGRWRLTVADGQGQLMPDEAGRTLSPLAVGPRGLAALYAGIPVGALRLSGLASGGGPDSDAALEAAFAATPYMVDDF